jgi:hypothetical protein
MANQSTKSGYRGDTLIGYRGWCVKCGQERRVYFSKCSDQIRRTMIQSHRKGEMNYLGSCEVCIPKGLYESVQKWFLMSPYKVDKDLAILDTQVNIDFSQVEINAQEEHKNDKWLVDNEKHVEEFLKWRKGKDIMI